MGYTRRRDTPYNAYLAFVTTLHNLATHHNKVKEHTMLHRLLTWLRLAKPKPKRLGFYIIDPVAFQKRLDMLDMLDALESKEQ